MIEVRSLVSSLPWSAPWLLRRARTIAKLFALHPLSDISVVCVPPSFSHELNTRYRRKPHPTNVLSFRYARHRTMNMRLEGELIVCPAVVVRESRKEGKLVRSYLDEILVHGMAHLAGYDHAHSRDARRMQEKEKKILFRLKA